MLVRTAIFKTIFILQMFFLGAGVSAGSEEVAVRLQLEKNYQEFIQTKNSRQLPFSLESTDKNKEIRASVKTFLPDISYDLFASRLSDVSQWCEFIPLHLNIKACGYSKKNEKLQLGFYVGAKGYMAPDEAKLLILAVVLVDSEDFLEISFSASKGPFGSSDYYFDFRAIGVDDGVYLEFDLSSRLGFVSNLAKIYFATVGAGKVGFSVNGTQSSGEPQYIDGQRGGAERNIVRYLLSIQTYFETVGWETEPDIYQRRLERWFDLTQQYEKQLYEMSRKTYLEVKTKERKNQLKLIENIKSNTEPDFNSENIKR